MRVTHHHTFVVRSMVFAALLILGGCATPYDSKIDDLVGGLQTNVDTEIVKLIALDHKIAALKQKSDPDAQAALREAEKKAGYDANSEFYDQVDVTLTSLSLRIDALQGRSIDSIKPALSKLRANLLEEEGSLQRVHMQQGILSEAYLRNERMILNAQFGAILTYQAVLKKGQSL